MYTVLSSNTFSNIICTYVSIYQLYVTRNNLLHNFESSSVKLQDNELRRTIMFNFYFEFPRLSIILRHYIFDDNRHKHNKAGQIAQRLRAEGSSGSRGSRGDAKV